MVAGVEEQHVDAGRHAAGQMREQPVTHRGGDDEAGAEGVDGPAQDVLGAGALELAARSLGCQLEVCCQGAVASVHAGANTQVQAPLPLGRARA